MVVLPAEPPAGAATPAWLAPGRVELAAAARCFRPRPAGEAGPALVLDLATDARLDAVREVLDRLNVAGATLFAEAARPVHGAWNPPGEAVGLFESALLLAGLVAAPPAEQEVAGQRGWGASYGNDAGWATIWEAVKHLAEAAGAVIANGDPAAAAPGPATGAAP